MIFLIADLRRNRKVSQALRKALLNFALTVKRLAKLCLGNALDRQAKSGGGFWTNLANIWTEVARCKKKSMKPGVVQKSAWPFRLPGKIVFLPLAEPQVFIRRQLK